MVSSVSFGSSTSNYGISSNTSTTTAISDFSTSFAPQYKETVNIDGETYDVVTVSDPICSDGKKEVVIIDGKQYDVKTVSDNGFIVASDQTKKVVVIDGQEYDVDRTLDNGLFGKKFTYLA